MSACSFRVAAPPSLDLSLLNPSEQPSVAMATIQPWKNDLPQMSGLIKAGCAARGEPLPVLTLTAAVWTNAGYVGMG